MQTCRTLYDAGMRLLLARERYLFTEDQFLRDLDLMCDCERSTVALVVEVLSHAWCLEKLVVEAYPFLFRSHPDLVDAICSLPSLTTLEWYHPDETGIEAIRRIQGPLENVVMSFFECSGPQDPADVLMPFVATIQQLRAHYVIVAPSTVQFLALRYLRLTASKNDPIDTNMFPGFPVFHGNGPEELWREMRQFNEHRAQLSGRWTVLTEVAGNIFALWSLALDCKVATLIVDLTDPRDITLLPTLLRDTASSRLCLNVSLSSEISIGRLHNLLVGASTTKQLELVIHIQSGVTDSGPQILSGILRMLESSRVASSAAKSVLEYLDQTEDQPFLEQFTACIPSLRTLTVRLGCKPRSGWALSPAEE
ncbi:hypothetical protein CERSUDRAFT_127648 [Gelatoporia subvermispora B]|uniref:F-box domain-containing protein n=1 Tax=Ceriporiopsis subvermispora (strain B) TaxID=914234 RepID=M2Q2L0_CERS8|nr:hypothetical protein CERSUDRAFT_127648 [Gelatoporia subvermispora B]